MKITTIIYDLGGVLIDWNPEYLYRKLFDDENEMKHFLQHVCSPAWNEDQDAGRSLKDGTDYLIKQFPEHEDKIKAYNSRWPEMLNGEIKGSVEVFTKLKECGQYKLYALTNWSAETFPIAVNLFPFLELFDGIVVSGIEKIRKPDPAFYKILFDRYNLNISEAIFIDDNLRNVEAAKELGLDSIQYTNAESLISELEERNTSLIFFNSL